MMRSDNPVYDRPIRHPAAWTSAEIGGKEGLTHRMGPEHTAALHDLVRQTRDRARIMDDHHERGEPAINYAQSGVLEKLDDG